MSPSDPSEDETTEYDFVYCASCGSKAARSWSYCRSCQSSLDDARPPEDGLEQIGTDETLGTDEAGCPKCGHETAEVDEIATTGAGLTKLFDVQNRQFKAVTCAKCGYTEFYRGPSGDIVVDLFLGG
ncbi:zinc ribbon domain-containing protein [Haloarcula sp. S1AR25-5A]|uniref:Zinc ribbon domain-containing protein n=1 Tax=Haloarcula terrestris TaxID=2950533 RepID=A0AAE4F1P0_9EURY|nr:zinc ribbon domain-containing protein [Haloarcula terrestris]MDS0222676.1 zinc ribbon domain-containing protein [Haloarcula terrestris]